MGSGFRSLSGYVYVYTHMHGVPLNYGYPFEIPYSKDHIISASILVSRCLRKVPSRERERAREKETDKGRDREREDFS